VRRFVARSRSLLRRFRAARAKLLLARREGYLPLKLNIGCGYDKRDGYLNIDMDPACNPDLLVFDNDLSMLPHGHFEELLAHDVLEHIPRSLTMSSLLDWASLLKRNGTLTLQTSDILGITDMMRQNPTFAFEFNWTGLMFGNQIHPGDFHFNGFTERTLRAHLEVAGFACSGFSRKDGWLLSATVPKVRDWQEPLLVLRNTSDQNFLSAIFRIALTREVTPADLKRFKGRNLSSQSVRRWVLREIISNPENLYRVGASL
jgi:hypothetical protein